MDGVIVNTEPLHKKAYYQTFDWLNIDVSEDVYNAMTGASTVNAFQKVKDLYKVVDSVDEMVLQKRRYFASLFHTDPDLKLFDGVLDLIQYCYHSDRILVLASSASMPNINRVFERFDLDQYFLGKVSGADLKSSKPHPEIFEKAAAMANISIDNCIVIEDSDNGIQAANSAGIYSIGYKSEHSQMQTLDKAKLVIKEFSELQKFF
jgi:HAD superfamily hydrolase (TIGR01509 family)